MDFGVIVGMDMMDILWDLVGIRDGLLVAEGQALHILSFSLRGLVVGR